MRVRGEGLTPCALMIVGEAPGFHESKAGRPFVGKTGDEIECLLESCSLPTRRNWFLTNVFREYRGKDYAWTTEDLKHDEPELLAELKRVRPKTIVTLGRHSTRYFLGDVDMDSCWGIPWLEEYPRNTAERRVIFPIHHPAAGFYSPEISPYVVAGFQQLALFLQGKTAPRLLFDDPIKVPTYEEITSEPQLDASLRTLKRGQSLAVDCEGWPSNAWSVQYALNPGTGYLIRKTSPTLLKRFNEILSRIRPVLTFHSALVDRSIGRSLGLELDAALEFNDTQVMGYLLQIEPIGLKPACARHCSMQMQDYLDIMGDVQNELARDYLTWMWDAEQVDYEETQKTEFDTQRAAGRRIKVLPKLPRSLLHKAVTRVLQSKRPRGLWLDQIENVQTAAYHRLGPLPEESLDYIQSPIAIHYGCRDADATLRLLPEYSQRIDAMGLRQVYALELSTYPLIDRMQRIGLKPDLAHFAALSTKLGGEISTLQSRLCRETGCEDFNANSGDQVAEYLFSTLGLEELKWTKGGRGSTNDKILEALEHEHPEHPIISTIRAYRETYKLKHTFVDRLPDFVHRWPNDGRVHATFRTTRVVTGRLASSDPNLLAQPEHGKFAPDFKRGWVAEDGHVLCQWDESQVELRGLAHLSQDATLLAIYRGEIKNPDGSLIDLHAKLAQRIFGGDIRKYQEKCNERLAAKAINFGIPMGMTCHGLSVELRKNGVDADEETAQKWLDETLELYQGVARYMEERKVEARLTGMVRCLSGRIRYIGGIRSREDRIREEAERFAFSTPIQESATFILKQSEAIVWEEVLPYFWKQNKWVEPLLQVHDCLKMECEEGLERELHDLMCVAMTEVPNGFSVPLAVEGEFGQNMASKYMDPKQYPEWDNPEGMRSFDA